MVIKKLLCLYFIFFGIGLVSAITGDMVTGEIIQGEAIQSTVQSSITVGVPTNCSNNITEGSEECDDGSNNGVECTPPYGGSCQYCTTTCELLTLTGSYCGDGTCNSANETESSCSSDCAPGGGGGGPPSVEKVYDFWLDKELLEIELEKGGYLQKQIKVTNNGTEDLLINVSLTNLEKFIVLEIELFVLKSSESKTIKFDVYAPEKEKADVYAGKIIFDAEYVSREANVVLDIKEEVPLFDIKTTVIKKYIIPGERVIADIIIKNLGDLRGINVELEYFIIDFDNNTYDSKKESFIMGESFSKRVSLDTSRDILIGNYLFYSKVTSIGESASSYDTFAIEKISLLMWVLISWIVVVLITIIIVLIKREREKKKFKEFKEKTKS